MTISIMIMTSEGGWECQIFVDNDLNLNIIHQNLMKEWRINSDWKLKKHPFIINEKKLFNYNIYDFKMHIYDCDEWMNIYCRFFYTAEISEVDVILSYPWLYAVNSEIDWKEQVWQYSISSDQISIINSEEFTLEIKKIKLIFMMMLSSLMKAG